MVVPEGARIAGRSALSLRLLARFGITLLGISRQGRRFADRVRKRQIEPGDVLLLLGPGEQLPQVITWLGCLPLAERGFRVTQRRKAGLAVGVFAVAIGLASVGIVDLPVALAGAAVLMVLSGIVPLRELYESVEWSVIVLLGSMIPIGAALEASGGTALIARGIVGLAGDLPAPAVLALLIVVTMTLSDVMNNTATAVISAPIALDIANTLQVSPDPFLMGVAVAASCAFLTPIGHKNNTLIMGPGGYRFADYWRMGLPLEVLIVVIATPMILTVWPLQEVCSPPERSQSAALCHALEADRFEPGLAGPIRDLLHGIGSTAGCHRQHVDRKQRGFRRRSAIGVDKELVNNEPAATFEQPCDRTEQRTIPVGRLRVHDLREEHEIERGDAGGDGLLVKIPGDGSDTISFPSDGLQFASRFERLRQVHQPSLDRLVATRELRGVVAGAAAEIGYATHAGQVDPVDDRGRELAARREHGADEIAVGRRVAQQLTIRSGHGSAATDAVLDARPAAEHAIAVAQHRHRLSRRIVAQHSAQLGPQAVAALALVEQLDGDQRVEQDLDSARVAVDSPGCLGRGDLLARRDLEQTQFGGGQYDLGLNEPVGDAVQCVQVHRSPATGVYPSRLTRSAKSRSAYLLSSG